METASSSDSDREGVKGAPIWKSIFDRVQKDGDWIKDVHLNSFSLRLFSLSVSSSEFFFNLEIRW